MLQERDPKYAVSRAVMRRDVEFIRHHGIPDHDFAFIIDEEISHTYKYILYYGKVIDDGYPNSTLVVTNGENSFNYRTDENLATTAICLISVDDRFCSSLQVTIPNTLERALAHFDLQLMEYIQPNVRAFKEGIWIAPDNEGFSLYYVDERGNIIIQAHGGVQAIAFALAAQVRGASADITSQIIAFQKIDV